MPFGIAEADGKLVFRMNDEIKKLMIRIHQFIGSEHRKTAHAALMAEKRGKKTWLNSRNALKAHKKEGRVWRG